MNTRQLILIAKILSTIFSPLYTPMIIICALFMFSYMKMLPLQYKLFILCLVYAFTVLLPHTGITLLRLFKKWTHWQLSHREHRHLPYFITLSSYTICLVIMTKWNMAMFFRGIVLAAFVTQIICITINAWWKVSTHMVGMGGLVGALNAFSILFFYNPTWPFCGLLLLSGLLGSSRMILRQHTLAQVIVGFGIGYACAMVFILISWI